jgi:hypothetical protein
MDLYAGIPFSRLFGPLRVDLDPLTMAIRALTPDEGKKGTRSTAHIENGVERSSLFIHSLEQRLPLSAVEFRVSEIV